MAGGKSHFDKGKSFPGRPDHPDFWAMAQILMSMDASVVLNTGGTAIPALAKIDLDVLVYIAKQRALRMMMQPGRSDNTAALGAMYMDGFTAGVQWAEHLANDNDMENK